MAVFHERLSLASSNFFLVVGTMNRLEMKSPAFLWPTNRLGFIPYPLEILRTSMSHYQTWTLPRPEDEDILRVSLLPPSWFFFGKAGKRRKKWSRWKSSYVLITIRHRSASRNPPCWMSLYLAWRNDRCWTRRTWHWISRRFIVSRTCGSFSGNKVKRNEAIGINQERDWWHHVGGPSDVRHWISKHFTTPRTRGSFSRNQVKRNERDTIQICR